MRLGICFNPPSGTLSGSQQTIADYLIPEIIRQHADTLLFTASPERFGSVPTAQIVALPGRSIAGQRLRSAWGMVRHYWSFPALLEQHQCDVVYYPYTMEILHRRVTARRMAVVHDVLPLVYPALFPRTVRLWRGRLLPTLRSLDAVITPSVNTREGLLAQGGFERRRCHVILGGYRSLGFDSAGHSDANQDDAERRTTAEAAATPYILYVASSHYPYKNCDLLMRAFDRLRDQIPHRLVILARGNARFTPALEALQRSLPAGDRITLVSEVTEAELRVLYRDAALFAYPSEFEGFGIPPLEAMSAGVPVVASDAASIPEICGPGALLVPASNEPALAAAMLAVLTDPARQEALRARGREQLARYTWPRMAGEVVALAHELAAPPA